MRARRTAKTRPLPVIEPTPLQRIDAEIADARTRAKALEADEATAAHQQNDIRWRAAKAAGERAWARVHALEERRAAIMAGEEVAETVATRPAGLSPREMAIAEAIMKALCSTDIFPLEDRVKALEARPALVDRGVWKEGETYEAGSAVSFGGSLWLAQRSTSAKPDSPDSGFRLAVKKGRDGKDAK
jgi:hypothetical protein